MRATWTIGFVALVLGACGGGASSSSGSSTATESSTSGGATESGTAAASTGACFIPSLGACQVFYADDTETHDAASCTALDGTFGTECPAEGRLGDCSGNGRLQARYYAGGSFYADAAAARAGCEHDGGTFTE